MFVKYGDNVGGKIKGLRKVLGMTQEELAEKLNVTKNTVSGWETNKNSPPLNKYLEVENLAAKKLTTENFSVKQKLLNMLKGL